MLVPTSPAIGVRESRRVHGDYRLTRDDVLAGRRFADEIALCGAPIEDHGAGGDTEWRYVGDGGVYGIPYRSLLPQGVEGLLVAGRCFSATHDAHASARSMATCMAMGQAAGTAAAMAAAARHDAPGPAGDRLRERLALDGALLDPVEPTATRCAMNDALRHGPMAEAIRRHRLVVVLRRVEPQSALLDLVAELADAGARVFEVTFDAPSAEADLVAVRERLDARTDGPFVLGAGTILRRAQLEAAAGRRRLRRLAVAGSRHPAHAVEAGLPFVPGGLTPTELRAGWLAGATFVKLFPASAVGPLSASCVARCPRSRSSRPEAWTRATPGRSSTRGGSGGCRRRHRPGRSSGPRAHGRREPAARRPLVTQRFDGRVCSSPARPGSPPPPRTPRSGGWPGLRRVAHGRARRVARRGGGRAWAAADLSQEDAVASAVSSYVDRFGRLDCVYNVAGISGRRYGDGAGRDDARRLADGHRQQPHQPVPGLPRGCPPDARPGAGRERSARGAVLLMSSTLATHPSAPFFATDGYAASKGAIDGLLSLARRALRDAWDPGQRDRPLLVATPMSRRAQADAPILAYLARSNRSPVGQSTPTT